MYRLGVMGEEEDTGIGNIGHVRWQLCLCLLLAWILVALFVCKGIKSSGKVSTLFNFTGYLSFTVAEQKQSLTGVIQLAKRQLPDRLSADKKSCTDFL